MGEVTGNQYLRVFPLDDLADGNSEPMLQFDFGSFVPEGFVFSQDGRFLYGSSYYTGISNIFRYEIATGDIEAVSNAETGFFRPIPMDDGRLMVFEYTGQGFKPTIIDPVPLEDLSAITFLGTEIAKKHPVVKDWAVGSPADVPLDDLVTHRVNTVRYMNWDSRQATRLSRDTGIPLPSVITSAGRTRCCLTG